MPPSAGTRGGGGKVVVSGEEEICLGTLPPLLSGGKRRVRLTEPLRPPGGDCSPSLSLAALERGDWRGPAGGE